SHAPACYMPSLLRKLHGSNSLGETTVGNGGLSLSEIAAPQTRLYARDQMCDSRLLLALECPQATSIGPLAQWHGKIGRGGALGLQDSSVYVRGTRPNHTRVGLERT